MQMNCIGCASATFHRNDGERNVFMESHAVGDEVTSRGAGASHHVSRLPINQNKTRSLIKRRFLSKTNLPESNKTKDNDNKIDQDKTSF
jgi:hypothetical protein